MFSQRYKCSVDDKITVYPYFAVENTYEFILSTVFV
jgi:hypothetical protein